LVKHEVTDVIVGVFCCGVHGNLPHSEILRLQLGGYPTEEDMAVHIAMEVHTEEPNPWSDDWLNNIRVGEGDDWKDKERATNFLRSGRYPLSFSEEFYRNRSKRFRRFREEQNTSERMAALDRGEG